MARNSIYSLASRCFFLALLAYQANSVYVRLSSFDLMKCSYGERGSLTATCVNATPSYFKNTPYKFDHLDETLRCANCSLQTLDSGTFDISGNQIKNLDLSDSQISIIKEKAFVGLIFLERLDLARNVLRTIYPGTFTGVKKITYVNLENNKIYNLLDHAFVELVNLKTLNLRHNQIEIVAPKTFNGLVNLNYMDLSHNSINKVKGIFNNLTSLQNLDLSNNQILDLTGDDFSNLTSLAHITFARNLITSLPPMEFSNMTTLVKLDLSVNMLEKITAGSFYGLNSLQDLDLGDNDIREVPQKTFEGLHSLRNLNMSRNKLTTFQTGLYTGLPQLQMLNFSHNSIEEVEITGVFSLHNLDTLDLTGNNITDLDYDGLLSRLPQLAYLNLEDNFLPCDLEEEMANYFSRDNFKVILWRNSQDAVKCVYTQIASRNQTYRQDSLKVVEKNDVYVSSGVDVWIVVLICVTLVLVAILYYSQYRIYREMNSYGIKRSTSKAQLISSEQPTESESLRE